MKIIHCLSLVSVIIAIGLLFAGMGKIASLLVGLATVAELVVAATTAKQSNDGSH